MAKIVGGLIAIGGSLLFFLTLFSVSNQPQSLQYTNLGYIISPAIIGDFIIIGIGIAIWLVGVHFCRSSDNED